MRLYVLFFFIPLCIATAQESQPAAVDTVMNCYPPTDTAANPIIGIEGGMAKYQNTSGPMFNLSFYSSLARHAQIGIQAMLMKFENSISYPDETTYAWHPGFLLSPAYVFGGTTMDYSISAGAGAIFPWLAVFVPAVGVRYKMAPSLNATATLRGFFSYRDSSTTASKIVASPFVFSVGIQLNR
jgi:hypothetical protein